MNCIQYKSILIIVAYTCVVSQYVLADNGDGKEGPRTSDECQVTPVIHVLQYPGCVPKPIPSFACIGRCSSYLQVFFFFLFWFKTFEHSMSPYGRGIFLEDKFESFAINVHFWFKVSGSKIWQMERSCMCCQESGEREAAVSLFCPKAKPGERKFRKVKRFFIFLFLFAFFQFLIFPGFNQGTTGMYVPTLFRCRGNINCTTRNSRLHWWRST